MARFESASAPITLVQNRWWALIPIISGSIWIGIAEWNTTPEGATPPAWLRLFVWPVGAVIIGWGLASLVRPASLVLRADGLVYQTAFRRQEWRWADVGAFEVVNDGDGDYVAFDVQNERPPQKTRRRGALPTNWPVPANELCRLLNVARERWR